MVKCMLTAYYPEFLTFELPTHLAASQGRVPGLHQSERLRHGASKHGGAHGLWRVATRGRPQVASLHQTPTLAAREHMVVSPRLQPVVWCRHVNFCWNYPHWTCAVIQSPGSPRRKDEQHLEPSGEGFMFRIGDLGYTRAPSNLEPSWGPTPVLQHCRCLQAPAGIASSRRAWRVAPGRKAGSS
jgi:hypothetical protein